MKLNLINERSNKLLILLNNLKSEMSGAAQCAYDNRDIDDGQGICDSIAEAISSVLSGHDINVTDGGHEGDDHAYVIAYDAVDSFVVDIPPQVYESGSGYSWTVYANVVFSPDDIVIEPVLRPDWI